MTGRRRIRSKQLLPELKENGGYCTLKQEALITLCGEFALQEAVDMS